MMSTAVRPASEVSVSGSATMASIQQLPALTFDPNDLRIVLVPESDDDTATETASERPQSEIYDGASSVYPEPNHQDADIPTHPVPSMQDAFAESLREVTSGGAVGKPSLRELDARGRRERLLEQDAEADPFDAPWRYRPGQEQHEVYKLIAQITFGVYLLLNGMAADDAQVVTILQGHIDEVDEFLEVLLEDFAQAHKDLTERIAHLQLPMSNRRAFEEMLEDRNFRAQILAGNEKIDHILSRTNAAMKQWDDDIDAGMRSSEAFMDWLNEQNKSRWKHEVPDLQNIFDAMRGNADGWLNTFDDLNNQAQDLNGLVIKLMTIIAEMEKTAGEVSRKTWAAIPPFSLPLHAPKSEGSSDPETSPSLRSSTGSTPRASIRSVGSISTLQPAEIREDEDSLVDFPLPGGTPLLPPPRSAARVSALNAALPTLASTSLALEVTKEEPEAEGEAPQGMKDGPLYILQPRTYTPAPPEPLPSPMVKEVPPVQSLEQVRAQSMLPRQLQTQPSSHTLSPAATDPGAGFSEKRTSLRQRVSLKGTPPASIHIPPRNAAERQSHHPSPQRTASQAYDSAHGSDGAYPRQHHLPRAVSHADFALVRPQLIPSPHSEHQQFYHPVRASPHSPLQQRPHTAGPADAPYRPQTSYHPGHQRNQPSRHGGASMLSNVTMATYDDNATVRSGGTTQTGGKRLKKKKSAFGWLKKAFTMDDSERAEYEARKQMQLQEQYYEAQTPRFLDGRRVR